MQKEERTRKKFERIFNFRFWISKFCWSTNWMDMGHSIWWQQMTVLIKNANDRIWTTSSSWVGAANSPKIDLLTRQRNQKILTPCLSSSVWTSLMSTSEVVFPDWDQKDKTFFARYYGTVNTLRLWSKILTRLMRLNLHMVLPFIVKGKFYFNTC